MLLPFLWPGSCPRPRRWSMGSAPAFAGAQGPTPSAKGNRCNTRYRAIAPYGSIGRRLCRLQREPGGLRGAAPGTAGLCRAASRPSHRARCSRSAGDGPALRTRQTRLRRSGRAPAHPWQRTRCLAWHPPTSSMQMVGEPGNGGSPQASSQSQRSETGTLKLRRTGNTTLNDAEPAIPLLKSWHSETGTLKRLGNWQSQQRRTGNANDSGTGNLNVQKIVNLCR